MSVSFNTSVKGGLPVVVTAEVEYDRDDRQWYVEILDVAWHSGKSITEKVWASIPEWDWDRLEEEALAAERW